MNAQTTAGKYARAIAAACGCLLLGVAVSSSRGQTSKPAAIAPATPDNAAVPPDVEKALAMPEGKERTRAVTAAAVAWAKTDLPAALAWAVKQKGPLGGVLVPVAMVDPPASEKWFAEKQQRNAFHGTMLRWAATETPAATAWCANECPQDWKYIAFFSAADGWIRKGDRAGAEAWAVKIENDHDRRAAIHGVAMMLGRGDVAAAGEWIKTLQHDDMKFAATVVASEWWLTKLKTSKESKKEEVVKPWLDQLPLGDAEKAEVMAAPAPLSIQKGAGMPPAHTQKSGSNK